MRISLNKKSDTLSWKNSYWSFFQVDRSFLSVETLEFHHYAWKHTDRYEDFFKGRMSVEMRRDPITRKVIIDSQLVETSIFQYLKFPKSINQTSKKLR